MDKFSPARSTSTKGSHYDRRAQSKFSTSGYGYKQADSRDLIITQLKREINDIKSSERDMISVNSKLSTIDHKYRLLQDEKNISERDYRARTENNMRKIAELKSEYEKFHRKLNQKSREFDHLLLDLRDLETLGESKQSQLEKAQNNLKDAHDLKKSAELDIQISRRKNKKENDAHVDTNDKISILNKRLDDLLRQNKDCDTEIAGLEEELRIKIMSRCEKEKDIEIKAKEINITSDMLTQLISQVESAHQTLAELDEERENRRKEREAINNHLAALEANIKKSEFENEDIEKKNHSIDIDIRKKNLILAEKQSENRNLEHQQDAIKRDNEFLIEDIGEIKQKIREIMSLNREVINTIAEFNTEDEQITADLDYQIFPVRDLANQSFRTASIH